LANCPTEQGYYYDHLRRHLTNLQNDEKLLADAKIVIQSDQPVQIDSQNAFKLRSIGLVKFKGNEVEPFCNLYRYYFREVLQVNNFSNLNDNETTLAAIMFTDTVNSTQLMTTNETLMKELLKRDFQLMSNICEHHGGRVLKNLGDGLLMYFDSAVKAVLCAKQIQNSIATEANSLPSGRVLKHRIGIHIGDVFMTGKDVLGAGVNIASRLQSHAEEGGICISQMVYDAVKSRLELPVKEIGLTDLKRCTLSSLFISDSSLILIMSNYINPYVIIILMINNQS
jgi:class 3 adenylate cyclase